MVYTSDDICEIIEACGKHGVSTITIGEMEITFKKSEEDGSWVIAQPEETLYTETEPEGQAIDDIDDIDEQMMLDPTSWLEERKKEDLGDQ